MAYVLMEAPQNYTKKPQESQTYLHCTLLKRDCQHKILSNFLADFVC